MSQSFISRVYIFEAPEVTASLIARARPDIEVITVPKDETPAPDDDTAFAVIGFAPGARINRLAAAKWVHCAGAGVDKLVAAMDFTAPHFTRTIGRLGQQMAEYVLAYYLRRTQRLDRRDGLQKAHDWHNQAGQGAYAFTQRAILFGTGPIGSTIAQYLHYLGLETIGVSRSGTPTEGFDRVITLEDLASVDPASLDLAVLALPDNAATRGLIDDRVLSAFRDIQLINVGRGSALPEAALLAALDKGHVGAAVLDVQETEPLPADSVLWDHPKITITPHVSGGTRQEDTAEAFLACLADLEAGRTPALSIRQE